MAKKCVSGKTTDWLSARVSARFIFLLLALGLSFFGATGSAEATGGMTLQGVNISGGEFNLTTVPGIYNTNYVYPSTAELDYFASKGMTVIRVPFSWERMQQSVNGPLDPTEVARMDAVVNAITARGMSTVLDPHNYGAYHNVTVGTPGGHPNSMFADFWRRLAEHYKSNPKVVFGLMNEPIGSN
ncbi:MAG TPA: cellulase family glycosylhydrolase, partial [Candidatus Obscuribacterales bacterium]